MTMMRPVVPFSCGRALAGTNYTYTREIALTVLWVYKNHGADELR